MRRALLLLMLFAPAVAMADQTFKGAWFTIAFPDGFVATPGLPSATSDGVDSARFSDPERRVEFYVYSPQAGGTASDLAAELAGENLIESTASESVERTARWTSYAAKDRSYLRSVEEVRTKDGLQNRVFSIKYRTAADLASFRDAYAAFKGSLKKFQD